MGGPTRVHIPAYQSPQCRGGGTCQSPQVRTTRRSLPDWRRRQDQARQRAERGPELGHATIAGQRAPLVYAGRPCSPKSPMPPAGFISIQCGAVGRVTGPVRVGGPVAVGGSGTALEQARPPRIPGYRSAAPYGRSRGRGPGYPGPPHKSPACGLPQVGFSPLVLAAILDLDGMAIRRAPLPCRSKRGRLSRSPAC